MASGLGKLKDTLLGRKAEETPVEKYFGADVCKDHALRALFNDAYHGGSFHSSAYPCAFDAENIQKVEWKEAQRVPGNGWKIMRLQQYKIEGNSNVVTSREDIEGEGGLTFLQAVEYILAYQRAQAAMGVVPVANPPAEAAMNETHVQQFAKDEGLVIDEITGAPHPTTEDGRIICKGVFNAEASQYAAAAALQKADEVSLAFEALPDSVLPNLRGYVDKVKTGFSVYPELNEMRSILGQFKTFVDSAVSKGWCRNVKMPGDKEESTFDDQLFEKGFFDKMRAKYMAGVDALFSRAGMQGKDSLKAQMVRAIDMMGFLAYVSYARYAKIDYGADFDYRTNTTFSYKDKHKQIVREKIAEIAKVLNLGEGDKDSLLVDDIIGDQDRYSLDSNVEKVAETMKWFEKTRNTVDLYVNGAVLRVSRRQIEKKAQEMVEDAKAKGLVSPSADSFGGAAVSDPVVAVESAAPVRQSVRKTGPGSPI